MGLPDDAKRFLDEHDEQVDRAIERAGDVVDRKTRGEYADQLDKLQDAAEERTGSGDTVG
jgi:hypothetical protein